VLVVAAAATIAFLGQGVSGALDAAFGTLDDGDRSAAELAAAILSAALFAIAWWIHAGWLRAAATEPGGPGRLSAERLVAYPTAIVGLAFGAVGAGRLLGQLLDALFGGGRVIAGGDVTREVLAEFVPYALLGTGVWIWQWSRVTRARRADPIAEGASTVRRAALLFVLAVSVLAGVAALGTILYQLFGALFGVDARGDLAVPLGALLAAGAVAAYHGQLLRGDAGAREAVAAATPATGAPTLELRLVLVAPEGADPADLARVRQVLEDGLPEGYRLRDDRRMS
jgi:hypothetical protein